MIGNTTREWSSAYKIIYATTVKYTFHVLYLHVGMFLYLLTFLFALKAAAGKSFPTLSSDYTIANNAISRKYFPGVALYLEFVFETSAVIVM